MYAYQPQLIQNTHTKGIEYFFCSFFKTSRKTELEIQLMLEQNNKNIKLTKIFYKPFYDKRYFGFFVRTEFQFYYVCILYQGKMLSFFFKYYELIVLFPITKCAKYGGNYMIF